MEEKKVKASDIIELVAIKKGYSNKCDNNFNQHEWYGFKNAKGDILRAKLITAYDKNNRYNIHKNELNTDNILVIVIIRYGDVFYVLKINDFSKKTIKIPIAKNENNIKLDISKDDVEIIEKFYLENEIYKLTNIEIANSTIYGIKQRINDDTKIDEDEVKQLFTNEQKCTYCGILQTEIDKLNKNKPLTKRNRGSKMEVDQKDPNKGYVKGNIVLTCYWCNNAKTDTFTVKEFKEIARGINIAWRSRGAKIDGFKIIDFDKIEFWKTV